MQYILKKKSGLWSLFVSNVFESFNKVNLYKETVIIITQCNVLITSCVLLCSLIYHLSSPVIGVKRMYEFLLHLTFIDNSLTPPYQNCINIFALTVQERNINRLPTVVYVICNTFAVSLSRVYAVIERILTSL